MSQRLQQAGDRMVPVLLHTTPRTRVDRIGVHERRASAREIIGQLERVPVPLYAILGFCRVVTVTATARERRLGGIVPNELLLRREEPTGRVAPPDLRPPSER
jgi:hypothetical protein